MKNFFKKLFCSDSMSKHFSETVKRVGKNNAGFSLVELIVVIAIMAILAAVAVIGVSVYIPKAQQANDKQLISDIEDAMVYAGYAGTFEEGESVYVVLSKDGVVNTIAAGSALDQALTDAFGANYRTELKLSYDKWGNNGMLDGLTPEMSMAVVNSSYMTGNRADKLLADVETMTGMASNLVTVLGSGGGIAAGTTLSGMFTKDDGTCVIDETAAKYGISKGEYATWEEWANASEDNKKAYSNLLVLAAADESEKQLNAANSGGSYEMSGASNMILEFSSFYAFAAMKPAFSSVLDDYMAHLNNETYVDGLAPVTDASTGAAWYNDLKAKADTFGYSDYVNDTDGKGQAAVDQVGFLSIMAGLGNPTDEQADAIAGDLSNDKLFSEGIVNDMYNDYMDNVDAMSGMFDDSDTADNTWSIDIEAGQIAILVVQKNGQTVIKTSLPIAE